MRPRSCQRLYSRSVFPLPATRCSILRKARSSCFQSFCAREDLVDALEGLEEDRVEIERLVEELDRAILVL